MAEVLNRTAPGVPLTVMPLGTENLLAKYLGMPRDGEAVATVIAAGATALHDAGAAAGRLFALMASFGFDAEVVRRLHVCAPATLRIGAMPNQFGRRSVHINILSCGFIAMTALVANKHRAQRRRPLALVQSRSPPSVPSQAIVSSAASIRIFDQRAAYAFGLQFAPHALGDDGWFDLCTFRRGSFFSGLWYLSQVILRRHGRLADCCQRRVPPSED